MIAEEVSMIQSLAPSIGIWSLVFIAFVTLVKVWPKLKELQISGDGALRDRLLVRIEHLESAQKGHDQELADERQRCDEKIRVLEDQVRGLYKRLNDAVHVVDVMIMLWRANPERFGEHIEKIEAMMVRDERGLAALPA